MKKIYTLLIALCLSMSAWAQDFNVNGIYYNITSHVEPLTVEVTHDGFEWDDNGAGYTSSSVNIPESVTNPTDGKKYSVTSIGYNAFRNCTNLSIITIPNSIIDIGAWAFDGTAWYNNQPNGLVYADKFAYAYKGTMPPNTNIILDEGTLGIVERCFNEQVNLVEIDISNTVINIGKGAFEGCSSLKSLALPSSVVTIGEEAFAFCTSIENVTFPNTVVNIGKRAFVGCDNVTSYTIPSSVQYIGEGALGGSSVLMEINLSDENTNFCLIEGILYSKDKTTLIQYPTGIKDEILIIPSTTTKIDYYAIARSHNLREVEMPNSLISIEQGAFTECTSLTTLELPNFVTNIGEEAFYGCTALTKIVIPNSVANIGDGAFESCVSLTDVTSLASVLPNIGVYLFSDVPLSSATLYVPYGSEEKYRAADQWKDFKNIVELEELSIGTIFTVKLSDEQTLNFRITSLNPFSVEVIGSSVKNTSPIYTGIVNIPKTVWYDGVEFTVTGIAAKAFANSTLTEINIPSSVTNIGAGTFAECTLLTNITIPNSVISIGGEAFAYCTSLKDITIPNSVTTIGGAVFNHCTSLETVILSNSSSKIASEMFYGCYSLKSITIPNSVTNIESSAFVGCAELRDITCLLGTPPILSDNVFVVEWDTNFPLSEATLTVPKGSKELYEKAEQWKDFKNIVELSSFVEGQTFVAKLNEEQTINFRITSLNPFSVEVVGSSVKNTSSIYTGVVNIPKTVWYDEVEFTVTGIAAKAFSNSTITEVTIPSTVANIGGEAFSGCSQLTKITIAATLPTMGTDVFSGITASNVELVVPSGLKDDYQIANQWSVFANITEDPALSIEHLQAKQPFVQQGSTLIFDTETNISIYNLSGACLYKGTTQSYTLTQKGMYIVVTESGTFKVLN